MGLRVKNEQGCIDITKANTSNFFNSDLIN